MDKAVHCIDRWDAAVAIASVGGLAEALGYRPDNLREQLARQWLATGNFASVFAAPHSIFGAAVVKLTHDRDQGLLALRAQHERPEGVVRVHRVDRIMDVPARSVAHGTWAIVEELVVPMDDVDRDGLWPPKDVDAMRKLASDARSAFQAVSDEVDLLAADGLLSPKTIAPDKARPRRRKAAFQWDMRSAIAWLASKAATPSELGDLDLHSRNMGVDVVRERLLLIDLGQVKVA